jgi:hypothetical protein
VLKFAKLALEFDCRSLGHGCLLNDECLHYMYYTDICQGEYLGLHLMTATLRH